MALIDEVKTVLHIYSSETEIITQITGYINEAITDLTKTADIKSFTAETADDFQKGAVKIYCQIRWWESLGEYTRAAALKPSYADFKATMAMSSEYGTLGETGGNGDGRTD